MLIIVGGGKQAKEGNHVISKVKTNSSILYCGDLSFDKTDTVNAGVVSDRLGGTTSSGYTIRVIEYIDPETEEKIIFYSTLDKSVRPGVISWLYFLRWKIEKVFDCFKNSFGEIKAWATGSKATQIQGNLICLVYNFVQFLSEKTKSMNPAKTRKLRKNMRKTWNEERRKPPH